MVRIYPSETFKEVPLEHKLRLRYAVSNYGRLISFSENFQDGRELAGGKSERYRTFPYKYSQDGKMKHKVLFLARLVANLFLPKDSEEYKYVLHLDYQRDNDKLSNLKWATREEMLAHGKASPHTVTARNRRKGTHVGRKLTATQVMRLKKRLLDPNRRTRIKILAKEFGVSEMQVFRIKSGENWGNIKV